MSAATKPDIAAVQPRAPRTLAMALVAAQLRAEAVEKDGFNSFHKYKYASSEGIMAEARAALSAEGLAVLPLSIDRDPDARDHVWMGEGDEAWISQPRRIKATYRLLHESGESMDFFSTTPVIPEKGRPEDKAEFGARTENLAYALRDLLLLPRVNEEVPSARDDRNKPAPRPPVPPQPAPAATAKPWMARLQAAVSKLQLGVSDADKKALKGKPREDYLRGYRLMYLAWCIGREVNSTMELTDEEATAVITKAEAGEVPS